MFMADWRGGRGREGGGGGGGGAGRRWIKVCCTGGEKVEVR